MSSTTQNTVDPHRKESTKLIDIVSSLPTIDIGDAKKREADKRNTKFRDEIGVPGVRRKYMPGELDLPGFGDPYDGEHGRVPCGTKIPHVCEGCGSVHEVGRTCSRSLCKRCAPAWVTKRAPKIVQNLHAASKMRDGRQFKHHVAVSPPPGLLVDVDETQEDEAEQAMISMLQEFMKAIDMEGIVLYHPYRGRSDGDTAEERHRDDRGEWKKRLFNGRDWSDVRSELAHEPHFHIVGVTDHFPGGEITKRIFEMTGWVFHRITERNGSAVSLGDLESVARAVTYSLSHCAIDTRGEQNRYVHGKVGSAYHNNDGRHLEDAKKAVHAVAPNTLGIPRMEVSCGSQVPQDDSDVDLDEILEDSDGEGSDDDVDPDDFTQTCGGGLDGIHRADYIDSDSWQSSAVNAHEALEAKTEWDRVGGSWQDWVAAQTDQSTLPPPD